jgi:hypothetical protein
VTGDVQGTGRSIVAMGRKKHCVHCVHRPHHINAFIVG